ncbi:MAG TPA: UDP-2,3-diacylglucosamine hydrolase [Pelagibacterium sp.]|jgi:UDP-2,3-diacylglucosamine pyrophosphatase LpxH|uniref:UDP-2,3-diacylglucosamine diphosphatase n=1 Tax=uncultured Pelagibacterium sp. TaxID=1159875 RepID=UPI000EE39E2B|nr:UDP-2,3-diacylglucosamine hydrolase [Pelagibacterium sp.]|tara:strand:+ start:6180 stop:6983 length:804 start_codon:yes stop_codon:yes gene_type:complete
MHSAQKPLQLRALFISDTHLGMRGAQAGALLDFLQSVEADCIYLVGDFVDGWKLKKSWHWPPACNRVIQHLLDCTRKGARIVYVPGNHDEFLREFAALRFGGIDVRERAVHTGANGQRYLVIHGDQFDVVVRHARWVSWLGDISYNLALRAAMLINRVRQKLGRPRWSLSAWARANVSRAAALVERFETALVREAAEQGFDGVVCGHIHAAAIADHGSVTYLNCGDWVENCTAIVETRDGRFELIRWVEKTVPSSQAVAPLAQEVAP